MNGTSFSARAPVLRRYSGNEAQALTVIAQRAVDLPLLLAGQTWCVSLVPMPEMPTVGDDAWRIEATWAGARFVLALPASAVQSAIAEAFPDLDLPPLPPELALATLEASLASVLEALSELGRGPARIDRRLGAAEDCSALPPHRFALSLTGDAQVIDAAVATDALGLMLVAGAFSSQPSVDAPLDEALPVTLRFEIGCSTLPVAVLASLALHDVVLVDHGWVGQDDTLWLGQGAVGLRVRYEDTRLCVTQTLFRRDMTMPASDTTTQIQDDDAEPASIDSIPVHLVFDLGERSMTLGELKALQVGQLLELDRPLGTLVNLRANGRLIGTGELVEIDGRLGVSIATLAAARV